MMAVIEEVEAENEHLSGEDRSSLPGQRGTKARKS
jgi:hypothetical protein